MPSTHSLLSWRSRKVALSAAILILVAIINETYSFVAPTTTKSSLSFMTRGAHNHHKPHHHFDISENQQLNVQTTTSSSSSKRRQILQNILLLTSSSTTTLLPHPSNAQQQQQQQQPEQSEEESGQFTPQQISQLLNPIPTYTLVEYPTGIPYAVVGEDAKLTSYFFTSYEEANRILSLATDSADRAIKDLKVELKKRKKSKEEVEEELGSGNPWKNARISVVPLDFAVTLVYASKARKVGNMYFKVAPAEKDVEEALALSPSQKELAEGKVPLFYFENFSLQDKEEKGVSGNKKSPLYFSKDELIAEWKKQNKGKNKMPDVKVTELFAVLSEMVNPQNTDPDLKSLYFVPPKDSLIKAKQTKAKNQKESLESPFVIGQRIIML